MNAPEKPDQVTTLPIGNLVASPTNPRKRFNQSKLEELAQSIRAIGVAQPLLVREATFHPGTCKPYETTTFEIVSGERRYRAATIVGLTEVPCFIRQLTDQQVLHIQLIENLQRDDLHPIEEAEGYERLMQENDANGEKYTADTIAAEIGKSRSYVFQRRKLLDLCSAARDTFFDGKIDQSVALLIARISPEKIQLGALREIVRQEMSYRQAHEFIQRNYMLELKQAVFDIKDASLSKKAGACTDCPSRTGNQPDLFSDVKSKDVCTDPVCFAMKKAAHFLIIRNKAEADGAKIIPAKEAQKMLPSQYSTDYYLGEHGFARPTAHIPNDPKGRTWEQALKQAKLLDTKSSEKPAVQPTIIEDPHEKGGIIQAFNIEQAAKALREAGYEITLRGSSRPVKTEKEKAEAAKLRAQTKAENLYRSRLIAAIHAKAEQDLLSDSPQLRPNVFRLLAKEVFDQSKAYKAKANLVTSLLGEEVSKQGSYASNQAFSEHLDTLSPQQCMLIMIDLIMAMEEKAEDWQVKNKDTPDTLLALASMHEIDAASIKDQAELEGMAEFNAKKAKTTAAKKASATKAPASARKRVEWPFPTPQESSSTPNQAAPATEKTPKKKEASATPAAQAQGAEA